MKQIDEVANVDGSGRRRMARFKPATKTTIRKTLHSSIRRILVPVDFSLVSLHALDYATKRAREYGADIVLLHVLEPILSHRGFLTPQMKTLKTEARREIRKRLALLAKRRVTEKVPAECWILEGEPGAVINEAAGRAKSDLIIMGSVGRKGIGRFFLGSVAERVVREANLPVTIVPPLGRRDRGAQQLGLMGGGKRGAAVVLIGPPGSGKTTLAQTLGAFAETSIIEVGKLLRQEVERSTSLGNTIEPFVRAGKLAPLEAVEAVVSDALETEHDKIVLFDGMPRTTNQIIPFLRTLADNGFDLFAVIVINIDAKTAMARLSGRRICAWCGKVTNVQQAATKTKKTCERCGGDLVQRADDRKEVVEARWKQFERETLPVINHFKEELGWMTLEVSGTSLDKSAIQRIWIRLEKLVPQLP